MPPAWSMEILLFAFFYIIKAKKYPKNQRDNNKVTLSFQVHEDLHHFEQVFDI